MTREEAVASARAHAERLYAGEAVAHRSCGVALAETFGLDPRSYQALRKGGITGEGPCGAIQAGVLVLGEILGDPDPLGPVTPELREGVLRYRRAVAAEVDGTFDSTCNARTAPFPAFMGAPRRSYCTSVAGVAAACVAGVLWDGGWRPHDGGWRRG
jgi:hypothetical protein